MCFAGHPVFVVFCLSLSPVSFLLPPLFRPSRFNFDYLFVLKCFFVFHGVLRSYENNVKKV